MSALNQANEIFDQALELPSRGERDSFVRRVCAGDQALLERVERLLDAHEKAGELLDKGAADRPTMMQSLNDEGPGTVIGRYKLLEKIGEGGFGIVYVAEQREPVKRRVALKIIKLGMDTKQVVARFEAERQALALMDHPNIAKVLDAGATDTGRPYFVMELVKGIPITKYSDQEKLATKDRLDLFIKVCHAIQHAHQKGIIHRDIKPSNILVTLHDGVAVAKVIDFGIAKATQGELTEKTVYTQFQQFIGTPAYMSPEQAEMSGLDIDTRSDIYALGVLLYEMLTGSTPFDTKELVQSGLDEMRKIIREREPVRPSTRVTQRLAAQRDHDSGNSQIVNRKSQIPSDLDWIVMKCLEKDRSRRYETANDVATDLKRHLDNEPVIARPPSAGYRFQKAWRRNKLIYSSSIAVATALVLGLGLSTWLFFRESTAYKAARAAETSEKIQRTKAESASRQAEANELIARRQAYGADINLAQQALSNGKLGVALGLLNQPRFENERGWEWRYLWQETRSEASGVFTTMPSGVSYVAASPDGSFLAINTSRGKVQVWDPVTRKMLFEFSTYGDALPVFSRTGSFFAYLGSHSSRSNQTCVSIWDPHRHKLVAEVPAGPCRGFAFSADEKTLVTCGRDDGNIVRWQLPEAREISTFYSVHPPRYDSSAVPFAITPDARLAAIGGFSGEVILADLEADQELWRSHGQDGRGYCLAFSPNGKLLAVGTGSKAGYILILDALTGREMLRLNGHHSAISALAFWPDGGRLASSSFDQRIGIWDLHDRSNIPPARMLRGHKLEVWSLALLSDAKTLASGSKDGEVCLWNTTDRQTELFTTSKKFPTPNGPEYADAPGVIWCLSMEGPTVRGVDLTTGDLLEWNDSSGGLQRTPMPFTPGARRGCWSRDGHLLAVGSNDGAVQIWELPARTLIAQFSSGDSPAIPLQFDSAGQRLALANDTTFEIWTVSPAGRALAAQIPPGRKVTDYSGYVGFAAELAPNLGRVPIASTNAASGFSYLWNPSTGEILKLQAPPTENSAFEDLANAAFSPDGSLIAMSGFSGATWIYNTRTGERVASLRGFFNAATSVAFSPDGRRLVVGSGGDGDIKMYDVATWKELITVSSGAEWVVAVNFSHDGTSLRAQLSDELTSGFIRSWRPLSLEQITAAEAKHESQNKSQ